VWLPPRCPNKDAKGWLQSREINRGLVVELELPL